MKVFPKKIRVAVLPQKHIFEFNKTNNDYKKHFGIESDFLNILSKYLHFKYELVIASDGEWGAPRPDGTWTGMIGLVLDQKADMALGNIAVTDKRYAVVDYSVPYAVQDKTFVTQLPGLASKATSFLKPIDASAWYFILVLFFSVSILLKYVFKSGSSLFDIAFKLFSALCDQYISLKCDYVLGRMTYLLWMVFSAVLTMFYSSVLLSFLTFPVRNPGINTIDELTTAVDRGIFKCIAAKGSSDLEVLLGSKQDELRKLGNTIVKKNWVYEFSKGIENQLKDDKTAVIGSKLHMYFTFGMKPNSRMMISDDSFGKLNVGIALPKDFCCKEALNIVLLRSASAGIYQKLVDNELKSINFIKEKVRPKISLQDVWPVFGILIAGYIISFLTILFELIHFKLFSKKHNYF